MTKAKAALICLVVVALALGSWMLQRRAMLTLREANQELRSQMARIEADQAALSNRANLAESSRSLKSERLRELLRLRNEVGALRRKAREFESAVGARSAQAITSHPASAGGPMTAARPAPFAVQLVQDAPGENTQAMTNRNGRETLHVQQTPMLDDTAIQSATVTADPATGEQQIEVEFSELGKELFAAITRENLNKRLAIVLDGQVYTAPVIRSEITEGKAVITGSFTADEARELAAKVSSAIQSR
jgi:hypothetical protein